MNTAYSRMKAIFKKLNCKEFTYEDFLKICKRQRIKISPYAMNDRIRGYYQCERRKVYKKKWIALNECLSEFERLYVALHELTHHFLHVSLTSKQTYFCRLDELNESKFDLEADAMALIMMIPQKLLLEYNGTPFEDINPFFGQLLIRRNRIYQDFGI